MKGDLSPVLKRHKHKHKHIRSLCASEDSHDLSISMSISFLLANSYVYGPVADSLKVPISPKYFFRLNKSFHLFEMHCAFVPLLNPNIDLLQAVKVTKSGHHLSHDRASKRYGSTLCLTSQTSLHACLQRLNTMQISL